MGQINKVLLRMQAIKNSKAQQQTPHHSSSHRKPPSSEKKVLDPAVPY